MDPVARVGYSFSPRRGHSHSGSCSRPRGVRSLKNPPPPFWFCAKVFVVPNTLAILFPYRTTDAFDLPAVCFAAHGQVTAILMGQFARDVTSKF